MKKILILLISICSVFQMQATHLMGGEITWECIKVGPCSYYLRKIMPR